MIAAETMTGADGHKIFALPHERLRAVLRKYNRLAGNERRSASRMFFQTGVAVFRGGLKKGSATTVAPTRWRTASTVISICSGVPAAA